MIDGRNGENFASAQGKEEEGLKSVPERNIMFDRIAGKAEERGRSYEKSEFAIKAPK